MNHEFHEFHEGLQYAGQRGTVLAPDGPGGDLKSGRLPFQKTASRDRKTQATLGRQGGRAKTPAKAAAARQNGKKGGRPRLVRLLSDPIPQPRSWLVDPVPAEWDRSSVLKQLAEFQSGVFLTSSPRAHPITLQKIARLRQRLMEIDSASKRPGSFSSLAPLLPLLLHQAPRPALPHSKSRAFRRNTRASRRLP